MRTMADFSMERGSTAGFHPAALFGLSGGRGNACGSAERQRTIPCALLLRTGGAIPSAQRRRRRPVPQLGTYRLVPSRAPPRFGPATRKVVPIETCGGAMGVESVRESAQYSASHIGSE